MVKFTDGPFQDAYLSSLRKNDMFDSPPPRAARKKLNSDDAKSPVPNGGKRAAPAPAKEYSSPILQRSAARTLERQTFLKAYGGEKLDEKIKKKKEEKEARCLTEHPSRRTKKLWDLNTPASEDKDEARDDNIDLEYLIAAEEDRREGVWDTARVRREVRKDIAKRAQSDLDEIEQFAAGVRRRMQKYGKSPVPAGESKGESEKSEARTQSDEDNGANDGKEKKGVDTSERPIDDGYGKPVVGSRGTKKESDVDDGFKDIDSFIHKFQTARIRHHPNTREDELMDGIASPKRGRKATPYRGINMEDDDEDGEEYLATSSGEGDDNRYYATSGPKNARLQRIREMKSQQHAREEELDKDVSERTESKMAEPNKEVAVDLTSWWDERKQKREDEIGSGGDRLESWWRIQRGKREAASGGMAAAKPFEELMDEPTVDDTRPRKHGLKKDSRNEAVDARPSRLVSKPPLSPKPLATTTGKARVGDRDETATSSLGSFHSRLSKYDTLGKGAGGEKKSPLRKAGPPCPETPTGPYRRLRGKVEDFGFSSGKGVDDDDNTESWTRKSPIVGSFVESTPQSSASAADSIASDGSRCHSVAQSALPVLLSRLEEAKSSFAQALAVGDVAKQAEMAGLMSKLGEAALTMRKLEQV